MKYVFMICCDSRGPVACIRTFESKTWSLQKRFASLKGYKNTKIVLEIFSILKLKCQKYVLYHYEKASGWGLSVFRGIGGSSGCVLCRDWEGRFFQGAEGSPEKISRKNCRSQKSRFFQKESCTHWLPIALQHTLTFKLVNLSCKKLVCGYDWCIWIWK